MGTLLALIVVVVVVVLGLLTTDWGKERLRRVAEQQMQDALIGGGSIGEIQGSLWNELVIRDLVINDASGLPAIQVARARLKVPVSGLTGLGVKALLSGEMTLVIDELEGSGLQIDLRQGSDGQLNLATLVRDTGPSRLRVEIRDMSVRDSTIRIALDDRPVETLSGFDMRSSSLHTSPETVELSLGKTSARFEERQLDLSVQTQLSLHEGKLTLRDLQASLGEAKLSVDQGTLDGTQLIDLRGDLELPASALRSILAQTPWLADIALHFESEGAAIALRGTMADATLTGSASPDLEHGSVVAVLSVLNLDLASMWPGLPSSNLRANINAAYAPELSHLDMSIAGVLEERSIDAASLAVDLVDQELILAVQAQGEGTQLDASAELQLAPRISIHKSHIKVSSAQVSTLLSPWLPLRGDLRADLSLTGELESARLSGSVQSTSLEGFGFRAQNLRISPKLVRLGERAKGSIELSASELAQGGTRLRDLHIHAKSSDGHTGSVELSGSGKGVSAALAANLSMDADTLALDITRARASYQGLSVHEARGALRWTFAGPNQGRMQVRNLKLASNLGRMSLDASLYQGARTRGTITLDAQEIDLHAFSKLAGLPSRIEGRASLHARLDNQHAAQAEIELQVTKLKTDSRLPAGNGTLALRLHRRELLIDMQAELPALAEARLHALVNAPGNAFEIENWTHLGRNALVEVKADAQIFDVGAFAHLHPELPRAGRVELHAAQEPGQTSLAIEFQATDLQSARVRELVQARAHMDLDGSRVTGKVRVQAARKASADLAASLLLAGPWFVADSYTGLGVDALESASLRTSKFEVDWLLGYVAPDLSPGLAPGLVQAGATMKLQADYTGATKSLELVSELVLGKGGPLKRAIDEKLLAKATLEQKSANIDLVASFDGATVAQAQARIALGWRDLLSGSPEFAAASMSASVAVNDLPLSSVREVLRTTPVQLQTGIEGRLSASLAARGTIDKPELAVRASVEKAVVAGVGIASLVVDGTLRDGTIALNASGAQGSGGRLQFEASTPYSSDANAAIEGRLRATDFDLGFLSKLIPLRAIAGVLTADITARGTRRSPILLGSASLKKGNFNPGAPLHTIRNANVQARLTKDQIDLRGTMESGRGTARILGAIEMVDDTPGSVRFSLETVKVPVDIGSMLVRVDSLITIKGKRQGKDWKLTADVERGTLRLPDANARELHPVELPEDIVFAELRPGEEPPAMATMPSNIAIAIRTKNSLLVKGGDANALVDASLDLAETLAIRGSVRADQGWIELVGRRYDIRAGELSFSGEVDAAIHVELAHDFDALTLFIDVGGTLQKPIVDFRSEPSQYDTSELLAFVLGASPDIAAGAEDSVTARATGVATSLIAGQLSKIVSKVAPIDVIRIDTDNASAERVALGKWLTDKLLVAYRHRFTSDPKSNSDELVFEYRFWKRWLLDGYIGQQSVGGDVLWIRRY